MQYLIYLVYAIEALFAVLLILFLIGLFRTLAFGKKETRFELSTDRERIDDYSEKLSKMVQFETVSHRGQPEPEKFREFHKVLAELFPTVFEKLEKYEIDGNLLMKWKGSNPDLQPIILISHQDVVAAGDGWKYPPFAGVIAEGKVWGRGAADIKCGVMTFYQAVEELLKEGYTPVCDVYLGSSCTEEIGGDGAPKLVNYFKERGIELFMLCDEGGSLVEDPVPGVKGNFAAIGLFEKGYGDLKFTARSAGGHSSIPPKNTPIARLAAFENAVEKKTPFKQAFSKEVKATFESLAPYCRNFALKYVMCNLWLVGPIVKKIMPSISAEAAAMLQTTLAFTMQKGSDGYNVIPQEAYVIGNLRYIPHEPLEESNRKIAEIAKKYGIDTEVLVATPHTTPVDMNGEPYRMTVETVKKIFPGVGFMPYVVTGGTDSRFFDGVCKNCIRFSPVNFGPEQMSGMHGLNENIEQGVLPLAVDYYKELIRAQEGRM